MFWISYSITFVLASAIAVALMAIRLVLSAVRRGFGSVPPFETHLSPTIAFGPKAGCCLQPIVGNTGNARGAGEPGKLAKFTR